MDDLRRSSRKNAGENKSLPADFTWPEKFGERTSIAFSKISNNSSHNSQLSLERQRIAIEMEKKMQTLEKQKLEIDNSMRLLQMEHDLENARLDAIEEVKSHRSQSNGTNEKTTISTQQRNKVPHCLYPEVMVVNDKSSSSDHEQFDLEVASKHKFVSEWVRKSNEQCQNDDHQRVLSVVEDESIPPPRNDDPARKKSEIEILVTIQMR
ncbi:hypothetical protein JTB14_011308 [Gonioctena quinquepunctata]|nr:hypothetical protein JTB14_011308 [Gonioctena quinquepunctata]